MGRAGCGAAQAGPDYVDSVILLRLWGKPGPYQQAVEWSSGRGPGGLDGRARFPLTWPGDNLCKSRVMDVVKVARRLSWDQQELLIAHVVGNQAVINGTGMIDRETRKTRASLAQRGLIKIVPGQHQTAITELGREIAAIVLGDAADRLVRMGALDEIKSLKLSPKAMLEMRLMTTSAPALTES